MKDAIKVTIKDNSGKFQRFFDECMENALFRMGSQAEKYAKNLAPTDTGLLKNSITFAIAGKEANTKSYRAKKPDSKGVIQSGAYSGTAPPDTMPAVYIGSNVEYATFNELGTVKMDAKPFLKPAVENHKQTYRNILKDEFKKMDGK